MDNLQFPLDFSFKISTLSNDFIAKDARGTTIAFVRQKMLKLVDEVQVFNNESKSTLKYTIKANKWIDFSATYTFTNQLGKETGRIARKGWTSLWKTHYEIFDKNQQADLVVREENAWIKLGDAVLGEIPLLGLLSGYLFNPSYLVSRPDGTQVVRLKKEASLLGRQFSVTKLNEFEPGEEERIVLGLMMMILLERRRG
ncbi:MAG: hypothetical protein SH848_03120 [Saprospiraceae bacterium]|nr:hypothetical protein [Saprospiraceae bacterium]MDZ4702893.1 hypothetical protein [Saprospiraceae bacterium]